MVAFVLVAVLVGEDQVAHHRHCVYRPCTAQNCYYYYYYCCCCGGGGGGGSVDWSNSSPAMVVGGGDCCETLGHCLA